MNRFTIAAMMGVVLVTGVALAALKNASDAWAGALMCLTLLLLGVSIVGVFYRRDAQRAFWVGFALFGCAYMLIRHVPKLWDQAAEPLPTTQLLTYLHAKANPRRAAAAKYRAFTQFVTTYGPSGPTRAAVTKRYTQPRQVIVPTSIVATPDSTLERAFTYVRIAGNLDQFKRVGHCVFALLVALIGGLVARWFQRSNRAEQPTGT